MCVYVTYTLHACSAHDVIDQLIMREFVYVMIRAMVNILHKQLTRGNRDLLELVNSLLFDFEFHDNLNISILKI